MQYDVIIIGGGVAGLSAAITASSEGLKTAVLDGQTRFGGQAGTSTLIENFIGFPNGISGDELIKRSLTQCVKFGVDFFAPFNVVSFVNDNNLFSVISDEGETLYAKSIILATGVVYRADSIKNLSRFVNYGVYYQSPDIRSVYKHENICIIGGANSAGQAAMYLSECKDCSITLIVRGHHLEDKMSAYLCNRIEGCKNITILNETEVVSCVGHDSLTGLFIKNINQDNERLIDCDRLFVLIGAKPKTKWLLNSFIDLDDNGYILTGDDSELNCMTSSPGIFAAGDIVSGTNKRVTSAVASGANCISDIHKYLSTWNKR